MRNQYKVLQETYELEVEANNKEKQNNSTSMDPEEVIEQIINKATVATQNYIKLLNNKRVPGIKLAEYIRQHIQPIILEILSYIKENNPQKKGSNRKLP